MLKHLVLAEGVWTAGDGLLETPKGLQLAVNRHFSLSSLSILEGPHCLSPPGGLDADPAAGVPVWQWGRKLCENNIPLMIFLHELSAVLTGQKKQALPADLNPCLRVAQLIYASFRDRGTTAPVKKNQRCHLLF